MILLEPSPIYRLFITRKEDILSVSTHFKKMKMDMHEKAATRFVRTLRKNYYDETLNIVLWFMERQIREIKQTNALSATYQRNNSKLN